MKFITVPKYPELAVTKIWLHIKDDEKLKLYSTTIVNNQLLEQDNLKSILYGLRQMQPVMWYEMQDRQEEYVITSQATTWLKLLRTWFKNSSILSQRRVRMTILI